MFVTLLSVVVVNIVDGCPASVVVVCCPVSVVVVCCPAAVVVDGCPATVVVGCVVVGVGATVVVGAEVEHASSLDSMPVQNASLPDATVALQKMGKVL